MMNEEKARGVIISPGTKERFVQFLKVTTVCYLILCAAVFFIQRSLIYVPLDRVLTLSKTSIAPIAHEVILQTEDGLSLKSWYIPPKDGKSVILFTQGNGGSMNVRAYKAKFWADAGYGVLLVEYRGYGGNPGSPREKGLLLDAVAGVDWLEKEGVTSDKIALYGESLGTGVVVQLAERMQKEGRGMAAMVLEAPFVSLAAVAQKVLRFIPVKLLLVDQFNNLSRIAGLKLPILILHGEEDPLTPVEHSRRLLKAARGSALTSGAHDFDMKLARAAQNGGATAVFYPTGRHVNLLKIGAEKDVLTWLGAL